MQGVALRVRKTGKVHRGTKQLSLVSASEAHRPSYQVGNSNPSYLWLIGMASCGSLYEEPRDMLEFTIIIIAEKFSFLRKNVAEMTKSGLPNFSSLAAKDGGLRTLGHPVQRMTVRWSTCIDAKS